MRLVDPDGKQIDFKEFMNKGGTKLNIEDLKASLEPLTGYKFSFNNNQLDIKSESKKGSEKARYYIKEAIKNKQKETYSEGLTQYNSDTKKMNIILTQ